MAGQPPPSSAFPRTHASGPQIPPFPQLLHIKGQPWSTPGSGGASAALSGHSGMSSARGTPTREEDGHESFSADENEDEELEEVDPELRNDIPPDRRDSAQDPGRIGQAARERKPVATRRRVVQSCSECRRRKIKCDKKFPCGPCILRSDQARCHEVGMAEKNIISTSTNYASTSDLGALAHRVDALESSLLKSGALNSRDIEDFLRAPRASIGGLTPSAPGSVERPTMLSRPSVAGSEEPNGTEEAALTLEHLAFGRSRMEGSHSIPHFGARMPSTVQKREINDNYHLARSSNSHAPGAMQVITPPSDLKDSPTEGSKPALAASQRKQRSLGGSQFAQSLTPEERRMRIDALLDMIGPTDVFDLFYRKTDVGMRALTKVLPTTEQGKWLVRNFLDKVDWLHRCLHVPTFLRQCQDLWALPTDAVVHEIAMSWLGLYLTVCCLGFMFADVAEVSEIFDEYDRDTLPDLWFNAVRSAAWASDFIASPTLESIQMIILTGVFLNNRDRGEASWALLGTAIKMAQAIGLSRLGAEQQAVNGKPLPMWTGRWESVVQREVGRRVWWNLVFLDWSLAPSYNFNTAIHPDQIKTALPANVDDEDLIDGQPLRGKSFTERTTMSFQLARFKFAEISHRQIWQANNNSHPPYSFVLSVDGELRKALMDLPAYFQPKSNGQDELSLSADPKERVKAYENTLLTLACHSRMLRLHRPWISRGYSDERFAYSREQAIRAARASLRLMSDSNGVAALLEKWWIPLFYVSVSGLVVIIDLLRTSKKDMLSTDTRQKIQEVRGALDQMRSVSSMSHPARSAVKVMDLLLVEVEERRKPGSTALGKRKAGAQDGEEDDDHNLQHAVKKLIRQAQLESDSPSAARGSSSGPTPPSANEREHGALHASPRAGSGSGPDMRIFSDTARERPVFGAYPMPGNTSGQAPDGSAFAGWNGIEASMQTRPNDQYSTFPPPSTSRSTLEVPPQQAAFQFPTSPYNFPIDPTSSFAFDPRAIPGNPQPQLPPEVESLLQSYFPGQQQQAPGSNNNGLAIGQVGGPQVPDDFVSQMFTFGWDQAGPQSGQGGPKRQGSGSGDSMLNFGADGISAGGIEGWGRSGWMA